MQAIGTIVRLKSGSPDLEIIAHDADSVTVRWQSEAGQETAIFPHHCVYPA